MIFFDMGFRTVAPTSWGGTLLESGAECHTESILCPCIVPIMYQGCRLSSTVRVLCWDNFFHGSLQTSRHPDLRTCRPLDLFLFVCFSFGNLWTSRHPDLRTSRSPLFSLGRLQTSGPPDHFVLGGRIRTSGPPDLWISGPPDLWTPGSLDL